MIDKCLIFLVTTLTITGLMWGGVAFIEWDLGWMRDMDQWKTFERAMFLLSTSFPLLFGALAVTLSD